MDIPVIIAVFILAVIAFSELYFLMSCPKVKNYPLDIILPICSGDTEIEKKLSYLSFILSRSDIETGKILLVNISATPVQKAVCSRFCENFPNSFFTDTENIKNFLPKIIDLSEDL